MSFYHTINSYQNTRSTKQKKAKEVNERRRQAQAFLRRNKDQGKQPSVKERTNG